MKNLTIFQLQAEIGEIIDEIIDAEIAGDTDAVEALLAKLDTLYESRSIKHEGYVHVIKNSLNTAKGCKAEADFFAKRATALNNLAQTIEGHAQRRSDVQHDEKSVTAGKFRIARQKNSQPTVNVLIDAENLPTDYQNVTIEADKTSLRTSDRQAVRRLTAWIWNTANTSESEPSNLSTTRAYLRGYAHNLKRKVAA